MADDKMFYVGQKAFIDKNGEVLVLIDPKLGLDFPGGKVQEGELDFDEALRREVREETSLEIAIGDPFTRWYHEFSANHRNAGKHVFIVGFKCRYLSGDVKISDEHSSFRWLNKENYKEVYEDSPYYKALEKYFSLVK